MMKTLIIGDCHPANGHVILSGVFLSEHRPRCSERKTESKDRVKFSSAGECPEILRLRKLSAVASILLRSG